MGSSRDIAIGPVAVVSLLLGTLLQAEIDSTANAAEYRRLAFTATFFAGITQATLGVLRWFNIYVQILVSFICLDMFLMKSPAQKFHFTECKFQLWDQVGIPNWLLVPCCHCWLHGWSCHHHCSPTTQRLSWHKGFHKENRYYLRYAVGIRHNTTWSEFSSDCKMKNYQLLQIWMPFSQNTLYTLSQWNWQTIVIAATFLCFLLFAKFIVKLLVSINNRIKTRPFFLLTLFLWLFSLWWDRGRGTRGSSGCLQLLHSYPLCCLPFWFTSLVQISKGLQL